MWQKKYSYFNTPKQTVNGKIYDSKFEAGYAQELELRKKAGDILGFDTHVPLRLCVNGYEICTYKIDFAVYHKDGTTEYVETKGYPTRDWKLVWKLFCALHQDDPNVKITLEMQGKQRPPRIRSIKKHI